jgi:hypothetical protein
MNKNIRIEFKIQNSKLKIHFLLSAFCFLPFFVSAQVSHEISLNGGGGLSTINYMLPAGKKTLGFGGDAGLGYTCVFNEIAGVHTGIEIGFYNATTNLEGATVITPNLTDNEGDRFDMHTILNKYNESQKAIFLNIPVMAHFQAGEKHKFYAMAGFKFGFPIKCNYKVSNAILTNEAYYPEYENWLKNQEFAGYGTFQNINSLGKLPLKVSYTVAAEIGGKWNCAKVFAIYTGVYFDYGLNNIAKKDRFVNYNDSIPAEFTINSALPAFADKVNLMAAGVKVRMTFIK